MRNAIYQSRLRELESLKMIEESDGFSEADWIEIRKRKAELVDEIYAMEHPVLEPMSEAELIHFEQMIEEEERYR